MTKREEVARALGKARAEYLGSKAIQAAHPEGCDLYTLDAVLAALREPSEGMIQRGHHKIDWCRDEQDTSTPDGYAGAGTTCRQDLTDAWQAMIDQIPKEGK